MTFLSKALSQTGEQSRDDDLFEKTLLVDFCNPKLTSVQKAQRMGLYVQVAKNEYQKTFAEAYATFAQAITAGDNWTNSENLSKANTLLLSAMVLLKVAEQKRLKAK